MLIGFLLLHTGFVGILFPDNQEAGYSAYRIWVSLGFVVGFAIVELSIRTQIWIIVTSLLASFTLYVLLEFCRSQYVNKFCGKCITTPIFGEDMTEMMLDDGHLVDDAMSHYSRSLVRKIRGNSVPSDQENGFFIGNRGDPQSRQASRTLPTERRLQLK